MTRFERHRFDVLRCRTFSNFWSNGVLGGRSHVWVTLQLSVHSCERKRGSALAVGTLVYCSRCHQGESVSLTDTDTSPRANMKPPSTHLFRFFPSSWCLRTLHIPVTWLRASKYGIMA